MSVLSRLGAVVLAGCLVWSAPAAAQDAKWEVEFHGGGALGNTPKDGTPIAQFPVGSPLGIVPIAPQTSRSVSSWYFGDGAVLLNQANGAFGVGARITPLDSVLKTPMTERDGGPIAGFRVARRLGGRFSAELNFDYSRAPLRMTQAALDAVEAARATFDPAWRGLLATGATVGTVVTSTADVVRGDGHQLFTTAAVNLHLPSSGRFEPYLTAGAGAVFNRGSSPRATLTGNYRFSFVGVFPIRETDTVTVKVSSRENVPVGVLGSGFKYSVSARQGLRVDVRVHLSDNPVEVLVDANPSVATATPIFAISTGRTPSIQFSNNASTGSRSSLSGPAVTNLKTFDGSGVQTQIKVAVGYYFRF